MAKRYSGLPVYDWATLVCENPDRLLDHRRGLRHCPEVDVVGDIGGPVVVGGQLQLIEGADQRAWKAGSDRRQRVGAEGEPVLADDRHSGGFGACRHRVLEPAVVLGSLQHPLPFHEHQPWRPDAVECDHAGAREREPLTVAAKERLGPLLEGLLRAGGQEHDPDPRRRILRQPPRRGYERSHAAEVVVRAGDHLRAADVGKGQCRAEREEAAQPPEAQRDEHGAGDHEAHDPRPRPGPFDHLGKAAADGVGQRRVEDRAGVSRIVMADHNDDLGRVGDAETRRPRSSSWPGA